MASKAATSRLDQYPSRLTWQQRFRRSMLWRLVTNPTGLFGAITTVAFVCMAIFAPWITPHDPAFQNLAQRLAPPFWMEGGTFSYFLGADALGRDIVSRVIIGSQVSLLVGFSSVLIGSIMGVTLGLIAGYRGGGLDSVIMRAADVQIAFPSLILAIVIMAVLGQSLRNVIIVLAIAGWYQYARVVRSRALSLREQDFVMSARAIGVSEMGIMFRHILPNLTAPIIVVATFAIPQVIIAEASLSFLGIGIPPSIPTWGNMLAEARGYVSTAWWLSVWPGVAIMLCLLGINLLGDWLRDALDPRLKNL